MLAATLIESPPVPRRPRRDVVEELLGDVPEQVGEVPVADARVQATLVWGRDHVLDLQEFKADQSISVGSGRGAAVRVTSEFVGLAMPIAKGTGDGFSVVVPERVVAIVARAGGRERIVGSAGGTPLALGRRDRVALEFGQVRLVLRWVRATPMARRALAALVDVEFLATVTMVALAAFTFERMTRLAEGLRPEMSDDLFKRESEISKYIARFVKPPPVFNPPKPAATGARAKGPEGQVGARDAKLREAARGKAAPIDPNKRRADQAKVAAALSWLTGASGAAANVLTAGGLGGMANAIGGLKAAGAIGDASGVGGLGTRGTQSGGGGDTLKIGGLGQEGDGPGRRRGGEFSLTDGKHVEATVVRTESGVGDALTPEEVGRVVRKHWSEIRYCYEAELQKNPNLEGKVAASFEIGPFGDVTRREVQESSIGSEVVEACILGKIGLWKFPNPRGGGVVHVRYPFLFRTH